MNDNSKRTYADAIQSIDAIHARDTAEVNPIARSLLLTHGHKTPRALLLWHGYTNSPRMYYQLAQKFFDLGYNVWTPRLPHSGFADRMTADHARLTRAEIIHFANETLDAARGLGDHLIVGGESLGGVMAAWAAQHRADVDLAVMINAAFAMHGVPEKLNTLLARIMVRFPNIFMWWDPRQRGNIGPSHAYPRFATRALAQTFLMGAEIYRLAKTQKPVARSILSITSAKDVAVNNRVIAQVANRWRAMGANISEYQFQGDPAPILHDIIDPTQANQNIDYFYPILIDLITKIQVVTVESHMAIYQTARFQVKPGTLEICKQAIREFTDYIRANESETRMYLALNESGDPMRFMHVFIFENEAAHQRHSNSDAAKHFSSILYPNCVAPVELIDYTLVAENKVTS